MKLIDFRYFGTLAGIISGIILILISFIFRANIIFINEIGQIPFYIWLVLVLIFILFSFLNKKVKRRTLNRIYLGVAILSFIYLNSMFTWSIDCCPENYDSMYEWNAAKGLSWIVTIPISFTIVTFQGLIYDFLGKLKNKHR